MNKFCRWCLIFLSPLYGPCFMQCLEFQGGFQIFGRFVHPRLSLSKIIVILSKFHNNKTELLLQAIHFSSCLINFPVLNDKLRKNKIYRQENTSLFNAVYFQTTCQAYIIFSRKLLFQERPCHTAELKYHYCKLRTYLENTKWLYPAQKQKQ